MRRGLVFAALLTLALPAQESLPESLTKKYPATASLKDITVDAEFLYRTVPAGRESLFLHDFLVVEVVVKGPPRRRFDVSPGMFSLRVNGRRSLAPVSASMVASNVHWRDDRKQLHVGVGPGAVIIGGPNPEPRFPGDPRQPPDPPKAPEPDYPREEKRDPAEVLQEAALLEGDVLLPASGCLYFPYDKKAKSIRRLELLYTGPDGKAVLRLK